MNNELISVIIPVYNTAAYLKRAIYSVLNNSYKNLEVICVNDGSTDESLDILKEIAKNDRRVRVLEQENGGVSSARNYALDVAQGGWIAFVDSDDWVQEQYFEVLLNATSVETDIVSCLHVNVYNESQVSEEPITREKIAVVDVDMNGIWRDMHLSSSCWGKLYRKETIAEIRFPIGIQLSEDGIFNAKVFAHKDAIKMKRVNKAMYFYYSRNTSLVHNKPLHRYIDASNVYLELANNIIQKDLCTVQAFRHILIYRYEGMLVRKKSEILSVATPILRKCVKLLKKCKTIPFGTKCKFVLASISPLISRISLIMRDHSYIRYEKLLRQRKA